MYEDDVGRIRVEMHDTLGPIVHIDIFNWSKENYVSSMRTFSIFMEEMHKKGFDTVYSGIPSHDLRLQKFALMYGFEQTNGLLTKEKEAGSLQYEVWRCEYKQESI